MKKGYLITAYDQPGQLGRLIRALQAENVYFFIHVDNKADVSPFREAVGTCENVKFVKSMNVTWMGFSQVKSTLEVMKEAAKERCDYYTLLSGSDYPIKSNEYILDFFSRASREYITFWKLEDRPSWLQKIRYFYAIDLVPIWDYQSGSFRRYYWGYFYKLAHHMPPRSFLKGIEPYGGCGWWSLSHDCLTYVLNFVSKNDDFSRFYRFTHCPIEMFFHTIILNSAWASRVQNYDAYMTWSETTSAEDKARGDKMLAEDSFNFRYVDWSRERTDGLGRPATLVERDFKTLQDSPDLFARKFDENASRILLDLLDERLRTSSP